MATGEIRVGDIGTIFEVTIKDDGVVVDISSASVKDLIFRAPDAAAVSKPADFKTNGSDGIIQYATTAGFLNIDGNWRIQALITLAAGTWKSDIGDFTVHPNL